MAHGAARMASSASSLKEAAFFVRTAIPNAVTTNARDAMFGGGIVVYYYVDEPGGTFNYITTVRRNALGLYLEP